MGDVFLAVADLFHLPGFYEPFSAMSHLLGTVLFVYLGFVLMQRGRGDRWRLVSLGIYSVSCVLLMAMSSVYHMLVRGGEAHDVMARLDHCAIFLLIAGTFTPTHSILFRGWRRWAPLAIIWTAAIAGLTLKVIFFDSVAEWFGLSLFLLLGWFGAISGAFVVHRYGWAMVKPLAWGGAAYTLGAVAQFTGLPVVVPGVVAGHEVWHIAVLVGALGHWKFIYQFAGGAPAPAPAPVRRGSWSVGRAPTVALRAMD